MSILTASSRSVRVYSRQVPVKPVRRAERPAAPFGEGLEERGLCCPIDQRPLPMINGQGLTQSERWRVNGAQNRAMSSYAFDCPEASLSEIENVGRKAATDELRRLLMERPAAPALVSKPEAVEAVQRPRIVRVDRKAVAVPPRPTPRRHTIEDERYWSAYHVALETKTIHLFDPEDDEENEEAFVFSDIPVTHRDLSDDFTGGFTGHLA